MTATLTTRPRTRFDPPVDRTADAPPEQRGLGRDGVRLLVAAEDGITHTTFRAIGGHLRAGDVLVVNNSATVAGEVDAVLRGRGRVVLHVATELDDCSWVVELRTGPDAARAVLDAAVGDVVEVLRRRGHPGERRLLRLEAPYPPDTPSRGASPTGVGNRLWQARQIGPCDLATHLEVHGRPIAYGYLRGRYPLDAYQTVFGVLPGSAEMASAARPFTAELVTSLVSEGVNAPTTRLRPRATRGTSSATRRSSCPRWDAEARVSSAGLRTRGPG